MSSSKKTCQAPAEPFLRIADRDSDVYDIRTSYPVNETRTYAMHENRVYSPQQLLTEPLTMPKHTSVQTEDFGTRLAALRKTTGYTQQQLADEIGVSRRVIAYYEAESENPPANLLADLARALNISIDELLGLPRVRRIKQPSAMSSRLERRLRQIEGLSPKPKQQLLGLIDTFIAAEELKRKAS